MAEQSHSGSGDNVAGDQTKIDRQANLGDGSTYVERQIINGERKIRRNLTASPSKPEVFLGREEDLQAIHDKLFSDGDNFLLLVNGDGGVGKTTLASIYYETYQSDYVYVAWVLSEKNIANALLTALAEPLQLKFEDALPAAERLERLLTAMAELKEPCLLVIDNANEVEDLENNYLNLRRCHNFHLLLTTRITEFSQAKRYQIQGLPEPEALELFCNYYPKHQDSENSLFKEIHRAVDGNTLVIELLAKNLHQLNRLQTRYSLADLLSDLQCKGLFALTKTQTVGTGYQAKGKIRKEKPNVIIAAMYDLGELPAEEVALLTVFSVLPSESIEYGTIKTLLEPSENLDQTLLSLSQKGWIKFNENDNTFKCSPVIQEITRHKNKANLPAYCSPLIVNLKEKLDYEPGTGHFLKVSYEGAALFSRYGESVATYLEGTDNNLMLLNDCIGNYQRMTGNLNKALCYL